MTDPNRGAAASKIEAKVDKIGKKAQDVFKKKPATATSSNAPTTSQPQPPPVVGSGSGTPPASQPQPLPVVVSGSGAPPASQPKPPAESTSRPPTRPSTPAGKQTASTGSHDAHSASTSNTADKAAKVPIPGGRRTPNDRLRTAILVSILFMVFVITLIIGC